MHKSESQSRPVTVILRADPGIWLHYMDAPREAIMVTAKRPNNPHITKMNMKPNTFKLFSTNAGIRSDEFMQTIAIPHMIGIRARL